MCTHINATSPSWVSSAAHAACSLTFALLGTAGNAVSILLILQGRLQASGRGMLLLLDLCAANLVTTAFVLPVIAASSLRVDWVQGHAFCSAFGYILWVTMTSECGILMIITVNQYLVILHNQLPSTARQRADTGVKLFLILASPWILSGLLFLLPLTRSWDAFGFHPAKGFCTLLNLSPGWNLKTVLSLSTVVLSTALVVYCYASIYWTHRQSRRRTVSSLHEAAARLRGQARNVQLIRMISVILVNFFLTYIPFLVMMAVDSCLDRTPQAVYITVLYVSTSHSATNPVIYALLNRQIRAHWRRLLPCCCAHRPLTKWKGAEEEGRNAVVAQPVAVQQQPKPDGWKE